MAVNPPLLYPEATPSSAFTTVSPKIVAPDVIKLNYIVSHISALLAPPPVPPPGPLPGTRTPGSITMLGAGVVPSSENLWLHGDIALASPPVIMRTMPSER